MSKSLPFSVPADTSHQTRHLWRIDAVLFRTNRCLNGQPTERPCNPNVQIVEEAPSHNVFCCPERELNHPIGLDRDYRSA
jgi:hypothetical protein